MGEPGTWTSSPEEEKAADVFDHLDPQGAGTIPVQVLEELISELFDTLLDHRAASFVEKLRAIADDSDTVSKAPTITRAEFIKLTVNDSLWVHEEIDTVSDVTELFTILCTQQRVTALPIAEAATVCQHLGHCTPEVLEGVVEQMVQHTNGAVITEADIISMLKGDVFHAILYPHDDEDLSAATLHARASLQLPSDTGTGEWGDGAAGRMEEEMGEPSRRRSSAVNRGSFVRRSGWKRFGSVQRAARSSAAAESPPRRPSFFESVFTADPSQLTRIDLAEIDVSEADDRKEFYLVQLFNQIVGARSKCHFRQFGTLLDDDLCRRRLPDAPSEDLQRHVFDHLDVNSNGFIEYSEFKTAFQDVISDDGEFVGFQRNFSDACLRSLIVEVSSLRMAATVTSRDQERALHHVKDEVRREKQFCVQIEGENDQLREEVDDLNDQLAHQRVRSVDSASRDIEAEDTELLALRERVTSLAATTKQLAADNEALTESSGQLQARNDALEGLQVQSDERLSNAAVIISEHAAMQLKFAWFEEQIESVNAVSAAKGKAVQEISKEMARLDETIAGLRKQLSVATDLHTSTASDLLAQHERARELAAKCTEYESRENSLREDLLRLQADADRSRDALSARAQLRQPSPGGGDEEEVTSLSARLSKAREESTEFQRHQLADAAEAARFRDLFEKSFQAHQNALNREAGLRRTLAITKDELAQLSRLSRRRSVHTSKAAGQAKQVETLENSVEHLKGLLSNSENELALQLRLITVASSRESALKANVANLTKVCQGKDDAIKLLKREARSTADKLAKLETRLAAVVAEAAVLQARADAAKTPSPEDTAVLDRLRKEAEGATAETARLGGELEKGNAQLALKQGHIDLLEKRVQTLQAEATEHAANLARSEADLEQANLALSRPPPAEDDQARRDFASLSRTVQEMQTERSALKLSLQQAAAEAEAASFEAAKAATAHRTVLSQLADTQAALAAKASALACAEEELSTTNRRSSELAVRVGDLDTHIAELERTVRARDNEINRLQSGAKRAASQFEIRQQAGDDAKQRVLALEKQCRDQTDEVARLGEALQRLEAVDQQHVGQLQGAEVANHTLVVAAQQVECAATMKRMQAAGLELESTLSEKTTEVDRLAAQLDQLTQEREQSAATLGRIEQLAAQLDSEREQSAANLRLGDDAKRQLSELRREHADTVATLLGTKEKLREALELVVQTSSQLDGLRERVNGKSLALNQHFTDLSQRSMMSASRPSSRVTFDATADNRDRGGFEHPRSTFDAGARDQRSATTSRARELYTDTSVPGRPGSRSPQARGSSPKQDFRATHQSPTGGRERRLDKSPPL